MDENTLRNYEVIRCRACGDPLIFLDGPVMGIMDHSHLLAKSRYPELETDPGNIFHSCRDCHRYLDNRDWDKIQDFRHLPVIMKYLKDIEPNEYNTFVTGLNSVGNFDYEYID